MLLQPRGADAPPLLPPPLPRPIHSHLPPRPRVAPPVLHGLLQARGLRAPSLLSPPQQISGSRPGAAPSAAAPPRAAPQQRVAARDMSVQRLRAKVQRADADLAAAIEESQRTAASNGSHHECLPPGSAAEEEEQLARAIRESMQEADNARRTNEADSRYESDATLFGLIDSLGDQQQPVSRCNPALSASARREGRQLARQVLQAQLASGGGF